MNVQDKHDAEAKKIIRTAIIELEKLTGREVSSLYIRIDTSQTMGGPSTSRKDIEIEYESEKAIW